MLFKNEYGYLSNIYLCPVKFDKKIIDVEPDGFVYPSSEHLYQRLKIDDVTWVNFCKTEKSPKYVKVKSRNKIVRKGWVGLKTEVMREVLTLKFSQNKDLLNKLKRIEEPIIEHNNHYDVFWGLDLKTGKGANQLGMLLEEIKQQKDLKWHTKI